MRRAPQFAVLFLGLAIALGCGKSTEKETETAQKTEPQYLMPTQRPYDTPRHLKKFGKDFRPLPRAILDTLRVQKKRFNITRDEQWPGQGGVLANDLFEVWYPEGRPMITHAMRVVHDMMRARGDFTGVFGDAPMERLVIVLPPYLEQFKEWTGRDWWHYSELRADTMTVQPIYILLKRGLLDMAMSHEYFQWAIGRFTNFGAPRWVEEGVASYFSREGSVLEQNSKEFPTVARDMQIDGIEMALLSEESRGDTRVAYYLAHQMVTSLVDRYGEDKLIETVSLMAQGQGMDGACQQVYGMSYAEILDMVFSDAKQT